MKKTAMPRCALHPVQRVRRIHVVKVVPGPQYVDVLEGACSLANAFELSSGQGAFKIPIRCKGASTAPSDL